jgi:divalent metal cation (Fe/Co/Zn/Cd) transporter
LLFFIINILGDHDFIVTEIKKAVKGIDEIKSVSEVQVYYKDDGLICAKVDIILPSNLTIQQAHIIAGNQYHHQVD